MLKKVGIKATEVAPSLDFGKISAKLKIGKILPIAIVENRQRLEKFGQHWSLGAYRALGFPFECLILALRPRDGKQSQAL